MMFRYILVLLLVNASYRSLGNPINATAPASLANAFAALAGTCENTFLSNQIKSKIIYCTSPHGDQQLECLIFYDINKQLCEAVGAVKLALTETDYTSKINEEQDVTSVCLAAKDWVFSDLTNFAHYKQAVDKVFKHPVTCGKICGVEDFMSDDANFFCKYFKWGTDMLQHQITTISTQQNSQLAPEAGSVDNKPAISVPSSNDLQDVQNKNTSTIIVPKIAPTSNSPDKNEEAKVDLVKTETSSLAGNQNNAPSEPASLSNVALAPEKPDTAGISIDNIEDTGAMPENTGDQPSKSPEDVAPKADTVQESVKPEAEEDVLNKPDNVLKTVVDKDLTLLNNELEHKEVVLENPKGKAPIEVEDYQDPEDGKEGMSDMQGGDDGDDPMLGDLDTKPEEQKPLKKAETMVSTFTGEREFYANPVQDAFPEEDDHFFPFFLTAVIMVVLLYVVYHNKNKVAKVFFGLVLEGRQATRRRNSRGHAYRRLDTLEQAMSANTAAPPSKIIY